MRYKYVNILMLLLITTLLNCLRTEGNESTSVPEISSESDTEIDCKKPDVSYIGDVKVRGTFTVSGIDVEDIDDTLMDFLKAEFFSSLENSHPDNTFDILNWKESVNVLDE